MWRLYLNVLTIVTVVVDDHYTLTLVRYGFESVNIGSFCFG